MTIPSRCALSFIALVLAFSGTARAQSETSARAEQLFQEAKSLMNEGRVAEACPKLEQARALDGGGGTVLALALCHEKQGRLATALGEFREALQLARTAERPERAELSSQHIADLELKAPRLVVSTERVDAPGLELQIDGSAWPRERWNQPWPLDPGAHQLVARSGQRHFEAQLQLASGQGETRFEIPAWPKPTPATAPAPAPKPLPSRAEPSPQHSTIRRKLAWGTAGLGAAAVLAGSYFGVRALQLRSDAEDACGAPRFCVDDEGVNIDEQSSRAGLVSTVAFGVAGAAAATSLWLFLTDEPEAPLRVGATAAPSGFGVVASGRF